MAAGRPHTPRNIASWESPAITPTAIDGGRDIAAHLVWRVASRSVSRIWPDRWTILSIIPRLARRAAATGGMRSSIEMAHLVVREKASRVARRPPSPGTAPG